jgi:beta-glucosidase
MERMTMEPKYRNGSLSFEKRADILLSQMTRPEKLSQLIHESPAIPRLGIPSYNWWNECLHGVARAGTATVFPQAIGLAAMFDRKQMRRIASAISDEARAKYHNALTGDGSEQYFGLTFWSPNINIFRDPRWGRGQETYGECPYLTSRMAVEFVKGLQGDDPVYLKTAACAKHFAAHSGPEYLRHGFNAIVSPRDLTETYLPAFEACVKEAGVETVMAAYNRVNGEACSASHTLLTEILRKKWGFKGHVVSDCEAVDDIYKNHKIVDTLSQAVAFAVGEGCDLNCCNEICTQARQGMIAADAAGMLEDEWIDRNLKRLLLTRFKLGMFDAQEKVKYSKIPLEAVDSPVNGSLALKASRDSMILLKNSGVLPLDGKKIKKLAVIGPNADDAAVLLGNYSGTPSASVTPLKGLKAIKGIKVTYARGCDISGGSKEGFDEALSAAEKADAVVMCMGLSPKIEGEECDTGGFERASLGLPGVQEELIARVKKKGKPVILVLFSGSVVSVKPETADAIIQAWYPGQSGGTAVAEMIFGKFSPSGRLPVTVYKDAAQLPPFESYAMKGRTYRYFKGRPMYPFGFGLSYSEFKYTGLKLSNRKLKTGGRMTVTVRVKNTGKMAAGEVVQLYISAPGAGTTSPIRQLAGFEKITLAPGRRKKVVFDISGDRLKIVNDRGERISISGKFRLWAGGVQPGYEKQAGRCTQVLSADFFVKGEASREKDWSVYIVRCADGSLYTGITKDIDNRIKTHNSGKGAQYTKIHGPVVLLHLEKGFNVGDAMRREKEIKKLPKTQKEMLAGIK